MRRREPLVDFISGFVIGLSIGAIIGAFAVKV